MIAEGTSQNNVASKGRHVKRSRLQHTVSIDSDTMQTDHQHLVIALNHCDHITLSRFHLNHFAVRLTHGHNITETTFPETALAVAHKLIVKTFLSWGRIAIFYIYQLFILQLKQAIARRCNIQLSLITLGNT